MHKMKSPRLASPNFSSHAVSSHGTSEVSLANTSRQTKQKKRKQPECDTDSLVFLATAASKKVKSASPKRKKFKDFLQNGSSKHLRWSVSSKKKGRNHVSTPIDSDSMSEADSNDSLEGLSAIFASDVEDSFELSSNSNKLNLTGENFNEVMQAASEIVSEAETNESDDEYFLKKREEFVNEQKFKRKKKKGKKSTIKVTPIFERGALVVLLTHPSSIALYKYVSVKVLSGTVSICGHEINSQSLPVKAFSSEQTGVIQLQTEESENIWMRKELFMNLNHQLQNFTNSSKISRKILNEFGNNSVVVCIEGISYPPHLEFVELYYPDVIRFKIRSKKKSYMEHCEFLYDDMKWAIQFSSDGEDLACEVLNAIRYSKLHYIDGPRVVVFGPKNSGKSSLLQYLVNKTLIMFPSVMYIDTDPGQCEFTPSGVVSLTEVKAPVIGPSFSHLREPISMTYVGGISADVSPDMYNTGVAKMVNLYKQDYLKEPLFVNTMGWIEGRGQGYLQNVLKSVKPTILVELVTEEKDSMFDYREYLHQKARYYQICCPFTGRSSPNLNSSQMRNLSLLSYFGQCQKIYKQPAYLNAFQPYRVCWDKISIFFCGKQVPPYRMIEAINGSIVALCRVDESLILQSSIPEYPQTLEVDPDNECLGFGLVRAVDEKKRLLLIVSPMQLDDIQRVNAILKGNITVPPPVFLKQPVYNTPIPLTDFRSASELDEEDGQTSRIFYKAVPKRYGKNLQN